jgi:hypothetical protein
LSVIVGESTWMDIRQTRRIAPGRKAGPIFFRFHGPRFDHHHASFSAKYAQANRLLARFG